MIQMSMMENSYFAVRMEGVVIDTATKLGDERISPAICVTFHCFGQIFVRFYSFRVSFCQFLHSDFSAGGLPLGLKDALHLLALSFATNVGAQTLFGEFQATLVFGHLKQLETAFLVRGEASDFPHQIAHKLDVLVLDALSPGWLDRSFVFGNAESFVTHATDGHRVFGRHSFFL